MTNFDDIADCYDDTLPRHVSEHYLKKRIQFFCTLVSTGLVLDVGSGTGKISVGLTERGFRVISLDMSIKMLSVQKGMDGYNPVNGASYALPFKSSQFDLVISVAAFHHIADPEKIRTTIGEMKRVTRKGGMIVIWDHNPLNPYWKVIMKKVPQDTGEERLIPPREIVQNFPEGEYDARVLKKSFVPDFAPEVLMGVFRVIERVCEHIPGIRMFAAHNVVVVRKK